ncbi:hypothetical protein FSP39_003003 [Pinctada imbricata]|uniref:G-protein coupled receptors family 1 profile domain-containing protein n=1 Tax=Pinctada imbricata TaxID=66713 RepID=A0AA88YKI3_PINIB|nr:hypothetical protein FSP39_003003 [Pinctada imbricata]
MVFLGILCVIGTIGNIHVLVVFVFKMKTKSTYVTYVTALAFIDFLVSFVHVPWEIMDLKYPDNFWGPVTCRIFRFNNFFLLSLSVLVLLVVAIDRYKRICRALKNQWSVSFSKKLVGFCIALSAVLNFPSLIIFGMRTVPVDRNSTVQTCFINDRYKDTYIVVAWIGAMCLITGINAFILIFTYVSIGCYITKKSLQRAYLTNRFQSFSHIKERFTKSTKRLNDGNKTNKGPRKCCAEKAGCSKKEINVYTIEENPKQNNIKSTDENHEKGSDENEDNAEANKCNFTIAENLNTSSKPTDSSAYAAQKVPTTQSKEATKVTKITCVITIVFIICHVPYFSFAIIFGIYPDFKLHLSETELTLYRLAMRLVFVNNVCNPFIYGVFDKRFIQISKEMYKQLRCCKY